jgi:hypothetical protein
MVPPPVAATAAIPASRPWFSLRVVTAVADMYSLEVRAAVVAPAAAQRNTPAEPADNMTAEGVVVVAAAAPGQLRTATTPEPPQPEPRPHPEEEPVEMAA